MSIETEKKPSVLFVRVHNTGRSQMAAAFLTALGEGRTEVRGRIRAEIRTRIEALIASLTPAK